MINFHKFSFYDVKRLQKILEGKNYWLNELNPTKIFLSSINTSMEISFTVDVTYIRIFLDDVGFCYYPPICSVNKITGALEDIKADCRERGIEYNLIYISEEEIFNYEKYNYELFPYQGNLIYLSSELANNGLFKKRHYKKRCKVFMNKYPDIFPKKLTKEDLNEVMLFLDLNYENKNSKEYFYLVNYVKNLIEHLYELELKGLIYRDEKNIYGIIVCSEIGNLFDVNLLFTKNELGCKEAIINEFAKLASAKTKYISLERKSIIDLELPLAFKEIKYYTNFKYEG